MSATSKNESKRGPADEAVARAAAGTGGWEDAVRLQRWATPDHADFYALAGEVVATLNAVDDLAHVLRRQVVGYAAAQQARGRVVYDDTRQIDPTERVADAAGELADLITWARAAQGSANRFWSAVGHLGTEPADVTEVTP